MAITEDGSANQPGGPRPRARLVTSNASAGTARSALVVVALGAVTVVAIYLPIRHLQAHGRSAPALEMPSMHMERLGVFWAMPLLEATGFAALIWAYLSLALGLVEAGAVSRGRLPGTPAGRLRLHRHLSLLVLGLILAHAIATAYDAMGDSLRTAFVPFQEGYHPVRFAFDLGILALYLAVLVGPSYYARRWIGASRWRLLHRLAGIVYLLALWHALIVGDDVEHYAWVRPLIWVLQVPLLGLFAARMVEQGRSARPTSAGVRWTSLTLAGLAVVAILGVIVVVATGSYDTVVPSRPF